MKVTTITLVTVLALSTGLAISSGTKANDAPRRDSFPHRIYFPHRMVPGVTTPGSTSGMGGSAPAGMYRDNDTNVYRDGLPRDDLNPHGG